MVFESFSDKIQGIMRKIRGKSRITEEAIEKIEADPSLKYNKVIVVKGNDWHQGVIGIVASRLTEKYGKP